MFITSFQYLFTSSARAAITITFTLIHFIFGIVHMEFCSFYSLATSSNSICKYVLHAPLTSLVAALDSFNHTVLGSAFGVLGNLWSQHDVIRSWLRLTATLNCF